MFGGGSADVDLRGAVPASVLEKSVGGGDDSAKFVRQNGFALTAARNISIHLENEFQF